jgi:hypothetical protein
VAVVSKVHQQADGVSLRVEAVSDINFRSLEEVFVVTDEIPWEHGIFYDEDDSTLVREIFGEER